MIYNLRFTEILECKIHKMYTNTFDFGAVIKFVYYRQKYIVNSINLKLNYISMI